MATFTEREAANQAAKSPLGSFVPSDGAVVADALLLLLLLLTASVLMSCLVSMSALVVVVVVVVEDDGAYDCVNEEYEGVGSALKDAVALEEDDGGMGARSNVLLDAVGGDGEAGVISIRMMRSCRRCSSANSALSAELRSLYS